MVGDEAVQVGGDGETFRPACLAHRDGAAVVLGTQEGAEPGDQADQQQAEGHEALRVTSRRPVRPYRQEQQGAHVEGAAHHGPARWAVPYGDEQQAQQDHDLARPEKVLCSGQQRDPRVEGREESGYGGAHLRGEPLGSLPDRPQQGGQPHEQHGRGRPDGAPAGRPEPRGDRGVGLAARAGAAASVRARCQRSRTRAMVRRTPSSLLDGARWRARRTTSGWALAMANDHSAASIISRSLR